MITVILETLAETSRKFAADFALRCGGYVQVGYFQAVVTWRR